MNAILTALLSIIITMAAFGLAYLIRYHLIAMQEKRLGNDIRTGVCPVCKHQGVSRIRLVYFNMLGENVGNYLVQVVDEHRQTSDLEALRCDCCGFVGLFANEPQPPIPFAMRPPDTARLFPPPNLPL